MAELDVDWFFCHTSVRVVFLLFVFPLLFCVTIASVDHFRGKFLSQQSHH